MHLYWQTSPKVRRVSHFYVSPDGLLTRDMVSDLKPGSTSDRAPDQWLKQGEVDETRAADSTLLYSQRINKDGSFTLTSAGTSCTIKPLLKGFADGARVYCSTRQKAVLVRAVDDVKKGEVSLFLDGRLVEAYGYDRDTGDIKPLPKSARQAPTAH